MNYQRQVDVQVGIKLVQEIGTNFNSHFAFTASQTFQGITMHLRCQIVYVL